MSKKNKSLNAGPQSIPGAEKDDALFDALGKTRKRRRRKVLIAVISILLILAIVAVVGVTTLQRRVREQFAANSGEVLTYTVSTGTISTVVSGSGSLTDVDLESVTVPEGVEITEVMVEVNDPVSQGDILATVDMASVISAMADLQTEIQDLDEQLSEAEDDEASDVIYAGVSGRIKMIYAQEGTDVTDTMYEYGALALLSLDGYMAVDVQTDVLLPGESITVQLSDDESVIGTVETVVGDTATILISDNGPQYDAKVTILDEDDQRIGSGNLYIHSPLRVTGYAGTVDTVRVDCNDKVSDSTRLFTLEDTGYSANYQSLLRTRSEKEETLLELLNIRRNGAVLAEMDGSIYSVDHTEESTSLVTISPNEKMAVTINIDESDILSLELGQEVTVSVSSISEDSFAGTLTEINRTSSSSGVYSAVIELEKVEGMLSGMTASVNVKIEGVENAILIPIEAVHKTSDGAYVYTSYDEELQEYGNKVDVVTGLENSSYVEIKSGLQVGDTVYYTEQESGFGLFGSMGSFGGMSGMDSGERPDFGGGEMPNFGGSGMPDFSGGMPGGGGMPSGGSMPGGFGGRG